MLLNYRSITGSDYCFRGAPEGGTLLRFTLKVLSGHLSGRRPFRDQLNIQLADRSHDVPILGTSYLGAGQNCQHLTECTKHAFSYTSSLSKSVHINIFQMDNLHENDKKKWVKMLKPCTESTFFPIDTPHKRVCFVHSAKR